MSLIFQSLQKLDEQMQDPQTGISDPAAQKSGARSGTVRWLLPVLIGLVLSLALGAGAVYGVQYLKDRLPESGRPFDRQENGDRERSRVISHPAEEAADGLGEQPETPQAPETKPEKEPQQVAAGRYAFHPPVQAPSAPELPSTAMVSPEEDTPQRTGAALAPPPLPQASESVALVDVDAEEEKTAAAPPMVDAQREAAERARRAALEKSARIGRLVRQIEQALGGSGEAGDPALLLKRLAGLKGENHPYVAKLRAYYNFRRGEMALAEADLHKVVAANPEDLEAGINLALIEIQDQRYDQALARLKALRRTYPENEKIADLIKRLQ